MTDQSRYLPPSDDLGEPEPSEPDPLACVTCGLHGTSRRRLLRHPAGGRAHVECGGVRAQRTLDRTKWRHRPRVGRTGRGRRAITVPRKHMRRDMPITEAPVHDVPRPSTRAECQAVERPCPWVGCRHHLYLDVNPDTGSIKLNFPDIEPWELAESCSLDVAERASGMALEDVALQLNLTRERVRQLELIGLRRLKRQNLGLAD